MVAARAHLGSATTAIDQTIEGMTIVRAYGREGDRLAVVEGHLRAANRAFTTVMAHNARFTALAAALPLMGVAGVLVRQRRPPPRRRRHRPRHGHPTACAGRHP